MNHNHIGRTFDRYIIKSATIVLLSKVGLGRTFDRSRFWRVFLQCSSGLREAFASLSFANFRGKEKGTGKVFSVFGSSLVTKGFLLSIVSSMFITVS